MNQINAVARGQVLVVDDDVLFSESLSRNLIDAGYRTRVFQDGPATLHHLAGGPEADLVLLDWKMPGMTGIEVLQRLRKRPDLRGSGAFKRCS
jgi:two-component system, OmpR family, response regulator ChvI